MEEMKSTGRTLVLCFDGTSNEYDADNTNIPILFSLLKKNDFEEQLCYYQAGVGTWFNPGVVSPLFQWGAKILDLAFAWYLDQHVMDGYKFIMKNWKVGDKICLFGFSRGAYTARALAGVLHKVGLLPKDNDEQVAFAYKLYKRTDKEGIDLCTGFKQTYCQEVKVEFIGVWDTVGSVGLIMGRSLPFVDSNHSVKTFRHALSLDEHRARFQPNRYHRQVDGAGGVEPSQATVKTADNKLTTSIIKDNDSSDSSDSGIASGSSEIDITKERKKRKHFLPFRVRSLGKTNVITGRTVEDETSDDVLEVWFSGCHSDVGGGAVPNNTPHALANITLRWMVREIVKSQCGIQFDSDALRRADIKSTYDEQTNAELDKQDALQPIHDQLKLSPSWWILELLPMTFAWQDAEGNWKSKFGWHLGRGRKIYDDGPVFHTSVKTRMNDSSLGYKPRAQWKSGTETYAW